MKKNKGNICMYIMFFASILFISCKMDKKTIPYNDVKINEQPIHPPQKEVRCPSLSIYFKNLPKYVQEHADGYPEINKFLNGIDSSCFKKYIQNSQKKDTLIAIGVSLFLTNYDRHVVSYDIYNYRRGLGGQLLDLLLIEFEIPFEETNYLSSGFVFEIMEGGKEILSSPLYSEIRKKYYTVKENKEKDLEAIMKKIEIMEKGH